MGRFKHLVDSPADLEGFKAKYHIPQKVGLQYCPPDLVLTNREVGEVVIPMIAFIDRGMTLPMGRITRNYLLNHRLCPHQCTPKSNKGLKDDYLVVSEEWHNGLHCLVGAGTPGGVP